MNSLIKNYINGNLTDAKKQAKRYSLAAIASAGFKPYSAVTCAMYIKGKASFQAACDASRKE